MQFPRKGGLNVEFKMKGAAVSASVDGAETWFWVIGLGPRPDTYICERCHTDETTVLHEDQFIDVI